MFLNLYLIGLKQKKVVRSWAKHSGAELPRIYSAAIPEHSIVYYIQNCHLAYLNGVFELSKKKREVWKIYHAEYDPFLATDWLKTKGSGRAMG